MDPVNDLLILTIPADLCQVVRMKRDLRNDLRLGAHCAGNLMGLPWREREKGEGIGSDSFSFYIGHRRL